MSGEKNLQQLIKTMKPVLNEGEFVFCSLKDVGAIDLKQVICFFKEAETYTVVVSKSLADEWKLSYQYIAAWITLTVHSSLEGVGFTAAFSNALSKQGISCNVIAAYYHDHIFVDSKDADRAMEVLKALSNS